LPNPSNAIIQNGHLESVRETDSFFYYVTDEGKPVSRATVTLDPLTGLAKWGGTTSKPLPEVPLALERLTVLDKLQTGHYEARILEYDILVGRGSTRTNYAIWLKADDSGTDLIYPVSAASPNPASTPLGTLYNVEDFVRTLRPLKGSSGELAPGR
jgi:hypothetical protein